MYSDCKSTVESFPPVRTRGLDFIRREVRERVLGQNKGKLVINDRPSVESIQKQRNKHQTEKGHPSWGLTVPLTL